MPGFIPANHEGDWEAVTIAPSQRAGAYGETFDFASFSQHGKFFSYLREVLSCDGGKQGSCGTGHAGLKGVRRCRSFLRTAITLTTRKHVTARALRRNRNCPGHPSVRMTVVNRGVTMVFRPLSFRLPEVGTNQWVDWPGRWGNEADAGETEIPPMSPANQSPHFSEPWESKCEGGSGCFARAHVTAGVASVAARSQLVPLSDATDAVNFQTHTLGADAYCANWFGGGVQALLCDPERLAGSLRSRGLRPTNSMGFAHRKGDRAASTAAVAQMSGRPIEVGQTIYIHGPINRHTVLFVRILSHGRLSEVSFADIRLDRGQTRAIRVTARAGQPVVRLVDPGGQLQRPVEVRR